ncbi:MAG: hypothetical protein CM1200mP41_04990 [Gammaproteobacteria bacterium]|nr:MAG: hypothetical protein CM1200mP41_04990 [Gammaproteobacteria bacterium]
MQAYLDWELGFGSRGSRRMVVQRSGVLTSGRSHTAVVPAAGRQIAH